MAHRASSPDDVSMTSTPEKEKVMDEFNITVRLRRNLKTKMGLCFVKGQVVQVKHSPAEYLNGFEILSEHYSAIHPLYKDGTDPHVTVLIPLRWVDVLSVAA